MGWQGIRENSKDTKYQGTELGMCGIVGIINFDSAESIDLDVLRSMTNCIRYRGPDDEGYLLANTKERDYELFGGEDTPDAVLTSPYTFCPRHRMDAVTSLLKNFDLAFGHRRLSIIDLSPTGHQPMCNEDGTAWIVYNGEIYNYIELRGELKSRGHKFKSNTDTEVIIHAYEEWSYECLQRLNGMWAFALWDMRSNKLFCACDRFGIKPFYYYFNGEVFIFASEIKALFNFPKVPKRVNEEVVYDYLVNLDEGWIGYSDDSFFKGIKRLRPAHYLLVDAKGEIDIKKWWNLKINPNLPDFSGTKIDDAVQHFSALLEDAIRLGTRADVPIAVCLSGGLDSSSITCLKSRLLLKEEIIDRSLTGGRLKTFSSCYEDARLDERKFIEEVVKKTGVEKNYVFPDGNQIWEELPKLVWHEDEPFCSTSIYAEWTLRREVARQGIKVVIDGQGGDELLAGYDFHILPFMTEIALKGRVLKLLSEAKSLSTGIGVQNASFLTAMALGSAALYWILPRTLQPAAKSLIASLKGRNIIKALNPSFDKEFSRQRLGFYQEYTGEFSRSGASLQQILYKSLSTLLIQYLRYADRDAMAFSIEARIPLLDYRLVEYVFSLPANLKIRDGWTKWILRQAMQGILPEKIRLRKDKQGFPTPEGTWLRQNKEGIKALFSAKNALSSEFVNLKFIRDNLDNLLNQEAISLQIWRYINLELWLQVFFGNKQNLKWE